MGYMTGVLSMGAILLWAGSAAAVELRVLDAKNSQPLPGASVSWSAGKDTLKTNFADAKGLVTIATEAAAAHEWRVTASKAGFSPMTMVWDAKAVPARFELALPEAQALGGRVVSEAGTPVVGAEVTLIFPQRLAGPRVDTGQFAVKTDTNGLWRCDFVPKDAAYVEVEVRHADFESSQNPSIEQLIAGNAELKMRPVV